MNNAAILPDGSGVRFPLGTQVLEKKHAMRGGGVHPRSVKDSTKHSAVPAGSEEGNGQ